MTVNLRAACVLGVLMCAVPAWAVDAWKYSEEADKMTSKVSKYATLVGVSSLSLGAPYSGSNYPALHVRQRAGQGPEVLLTIQKGQMMCKSYRPCTIKVRFDDAQPVTFSGTGSSDHDPTVAFIQNPAKFIAGASKATTILVQTEIFHNGVPVMEFKPEQPLKWGGAAKTKAK